jgi:hypothetical protein
MRTHYFCGTTINCETGAHQLDYYIVVDNLLNHNCETAGEVFGIRVDMAGLSETVRDITSKYDEIVKFALRLREFEVTPTTLHDIVCDSLPL